MARSRAPLQSGQVCSTITLSSHSSILRVGFAALPIAAVPALDAPGDAVEADLLALVIVALDLASGGEVSTTFFGSIP